MAEWDALLPEQPGDGRLANAVRVSQLASRTAGLVVNAELGDLLWVQSTTNLAWCGRYTWFAWF